MWYDEAFFRQLLDNLYDGVYFVDHNRVITYWNKGAERLSGFTAAEVIGRGCRDNILVHVDTQGCQLCLEGCPLGSTMADGKERQSEVFMNHKAGHRVPVKVSASPIRNADGVIIGAVEIFRDNSTRTSDQQLIEDLQNMAFLDPLTGLANRRFLQNALQRQLEELHRYGWPFGVLFFDVDHFKLFNDEHGHEVGDAVLKMVSKTMANCSRSFDTVGRWGGRNLSPLLPMPTRKKSYGLRIGIDS